MFPYLFRKFTEYLLICAVILSLSSCFAVKDYKPNTPFVYKTNVHVEGGLSASVKKDLEYELNQRMDNGMQVPIKQKFLIKKTLSKPLTFDTNSVQKTITFMENYLHVSGYYRD